MFATIPEIRVGPAHLTIHQGSTFFVTDADGEVSPTEELGLFCRDTRFLSLYNFLINGEKWRRVQATPLSSRANRIYFTNSVLHLLDGEPIPEQSLGFQVERRMGDDGLHEQLTLHNYSTSPLHLRLRIRLDADFADLFDVRNHRYFSRGSCDSYWEADKQELRIAYRNQDFDRTLVYRIERADSAPHFSNGQFLFLIDLQPAGAWQSHNCFNFLMHGAHLDPSGSLANSSSHPEAHHESHDNWRSATTLVESSSYTLRTMYRQAVIDIGSLRMHEYDDVAADLWVPGAGVPWYMTLFGRDSLVVSLQSMLVSAPFAVGPLTKLAQFQATVDDPFRDAEPGKIMHEVRFGELAHFKKVPHTPYYGTADATILYTIVLSELFRWTGNRELVERFREPALACLSWIDRYGDSDSDGFQEYKTRSTVGYYNQGWKDSGEAVMYPDGNLVKLPIALCELQGYVYDAKLRMAELFEALGDRELPDRLRGEALALRKRFHEAFWLKDSGFLAYCLDGEKRPVATVVSNPGHCLWSGIMEPAEAGQLAARLFRADMWSGWGVRTLSSEHPAYDPLQYQRGSVWPHDNGIIAAGLCRYGQRELANRIVTGICEAASMFEHFRLPELFSGLPRGTDPFPVQCLQANIPQAWASGSVFDLTRTMLGINADAPNATLYVDPFLPPWLNDLTLTNLHVGKSRLGLKFYRAAGKPGFEVIEISGEKIKVEHGPPPWFEKP